MIIHIEPIREKDFEELISLFQEFAVFEKQPEMMINTVEKIREQKEFFLGFVGRDDHGNLLGYVTYFFAYYTWVGKSLYMDDLYVKEEYRGKGVGSSLIHKVITFAKEQKCSRLRWQVSSWNNPAISFYESLGAEINKTEMNCDLSFNSGNN